MNTHNTPRYATILVELVTADGCRHAADGEATPDWLAE